MSARPRNKLPEPRPENYHRDVRPKLRPGDLLLFRGSRWFSSLIESMERGEYSHSAVVLRWDSRIMIAQAEYPRLEAVPLSVAVKKYEGRVDWYPLKPDLNLDVARLTHEATRLLGRPFAVWDLARVGFAHFFGRPIKKERRGDLAMFCSEYVAHCFDKAGSPVVAGDNPHAVTPDDLRKSPLHQYKSTIHWDASSQPLEAAVPLERVG